MTLGSIVKIWILVAATAMATGAALVPPSAATAAAPGYDNSSVPPATPEQIANDAQFRRELGLRADREHVEWLYDAAAAGTIEATTAVGAIVTPAEEQVLLARTDAVDHVVAVADDYFEARGDDYAGTWIDQARGTVGIGVTRNAVSHEQALAALIGDTNADWDVTTLDYTLEYLYALQKSVDAKITEFERQGVEVSSTSVDEEQNRVYVAVASDSVGARRFIDAQFPGAPISVEYEPRPLLKGVDATNSPPLRGGQRIIGARNGTAFSSCTSAFVGYIVERLDAAIFQHWYLLMTAGHCEAANGVGRTGAAWTQVTHPVGTSDRNVFKSGSAADAMAIPMPSVWKSNQVAIASGTYWPVSCMMTTDAKQGQTELMSGATSGGYTSGKLLRKGVTVRARDPQSGLVVTLVNQNMANYSNRGGDSGGSVVGTRECRYRAQGVNSSGTEPGAPVVRSYYTPIAAATKHLGLAGVVTSP